MLLGLRRAVLAPSLMRPPAPALARGFKKKVVEAAPAKKKTSGSDPYGALKRAILSEPDPEALQKG